MPTILDSNVILDLLNPISDGSEWSIRWFRRCGEEGGMIVNPVVLAESSARIEQLADVVGMLQRAGLTYEALSIEAAHLAGRAHFHYRRSGGMRDRVLPDFLIGAHAATRGYRILSRDQARYRTYFKTVEVIAPDTHP